jgi:hypothetical protein
LVFGLQVAHATGHHGFALGDSYAKYGYIGAFQPIQDLVQRSFAESVHTCGDEQDRFLFFNSELSVS